MGESEQNLEKYGEPLTFEKSFKGPLAKRSCTDVICLIIFLVFLGCWAFVAFFAFTKGDLSRLLVPTDSHNRKCGVDSNVLDKPYLFFFNLKKCIDPVATISGCPTPQVCVSECPKETFAFQTFQGSDAELRSKLICVDGVDKTYLTRTEAEKLIDNEKCAAWYVKSRPILNRCMWEFSESVCEFIPSYILDRSKRDAWAFPESKVNVSREPHHSNSGSNQVSVNLEAPFSSLTVGDDYGKTPEENFAVDNFQVFNQKKLPDEPRVQCKIRQQLGEEVIMKKLRRTDTYLGRFIGNVVAHFYRGDDAQKKRCVPYEDLADPPIAFLDLNNNFFQKASFSLQNLNSFGQQLVEDIMNSWVTVLVALIGAMVTSLIFIVLMRWLAAPVVWFSIVGVLAGLGYAIYLTAKSYIYWRDTPHTPNHSPNLSAKVQNLLEDKTTWLVLCIIASVIFTILLLLVIFLRKRIVVAIALIREGSKAVGSIISTVFFPICPWVLQIATIAFAIVVGMHLASIGDPTFRVIGEFKDCKCTNEAANYKHGQACKPDIFKQYCNKDCAAGCYFDTLKGPSIVGYMHAYNFIGFLWLMFFISAFGDMVLAATFATWYWTFHKSDVPFFTLTRALGRTVRYHMGTLAFGSLIITICRIIRIILEYIDAQLKKYDNPFTRAILCCLKCFFWCLENFLKFLNKNAYIMCAIHGKNFCTSAKDAFNLLMRNILRVVTVDKVTSLLFFFSKLLISAAVGAATYFYVVGFPEQYKLHYNWVPTMIVVILTYLIATVFFGVYSMAVDTLFLCFLEDSERNDGSAEKPYFMSKSLMKILGKRNEVPRHQYR